LDLSNVVGLDFKPNVMCLPKRPFRKCLLISTLVGEGSGSIHTIMGE